MEKDNFDFYRRAAIVCRRIPYGKTATYGQIALLCGKPRNARQVGYALNRGRLGDEQEICRDGSWRRKA